MIRFKNTTGATVHGDTGQYGSWTSLRQELKLTSGITDPTEGVL
jgi:hypothetical protein